MTNQAATKARLAFCLWLLVSFCPLSRAEKPPSLDQVLLGVQERVKEFEFSLPDFMCRERITVREMARGKLVDQRISVSIFTGTQNTDEKGRPFTESRQLETENGFRIIKGQQLRLPFFFGGGFSSILEATFGEKNIQYHQYKLTGTEQVDGKQALVIQFATKPGQTGLSFEFLGMELASRDTGKAWIDPASMHVVRLERRYLNLPQPYSALNVWVSYAPVLLNGKTFWMPKTVRVQEVFARSKKPITAEYVAEYSDYQKFDVSVKIKY